MLYSGGASRRNAMQQADDLFTQLSNIRKYTMDSSAQFKADQAGYRDQVAGFTEASNALKVSAQAFTNKDNVFVKKDNTKLVSAVRDLAAKYNEINDNLQTADNLTKRSQKLLDGVQGQFIGYRRTEYQNVGITLDNQTGNIELDTTKLINALKENPGKVERLLSGTGGLASAAEKMAQKAISTPAAAYFKAPVLSSYFDYGASMGIGAQQNSYNYLQGLFFDLMA
jgi:flagellar capping protein FliD